MMRALWRDGAVYAVATIVTRGLGLLLLPFYTRALPPQAFGLMDLILTAGVLVNLVVPLETPQAVARLWNERADGPPRRTLAGTGLVFALLGYAAFVALAWPFAGALALALGASAGDAAAVRAGVAAIAANGLLVVVQGPFRYMLRARAFATSAVAYGVLTLAGTAVLVFSGRASVPAVLWVQAASAGAVALASAWVLRGAIDWRLDRRELARMLRFSAPLVPAGIAIFATLHLQRFVLNAHASLEAVGLFGIAARIGSVATLALLGVQGALTPLIYAHHAEPGTPAQLARLLEAFSALALLVCLALALFGREAVAIVASPAYADAAPLVAWLAPAALLAQMYIFAPGIPLAKKTHWQLWLTTASAALGLALALWLVPPWQALGAALAACAAAAAFFIAWLTLGQRLYWLPLRFGALGAATVVYAGLAGIGSRLEGGLFDLTIWASKIGMLLVMAAVLAASGLLRRPRIGAGDA